MTQIQCEGCSNPFDTDAVRRVTFTHPIDKQATFTLDCCDRCQRVYGGAFRRQGFVVEVLPPPLVTQGGLACLVLL